MFASGLLLDSLEHSCTVESTPVLPSACCLDGPSALTIVKGVRNRDLDAMEMLFSFTVRASRGVLRRQVFAIDYEDRLHDVFVVVLRAILDNRIRQPESLPGFIVTIARRSVCSYIRERVTVRQKHVPLAATALEVPDSRASPESALLHAEERKDMLRRLALLTPSDREILSRFYLHEQDRHRICADLGITETQFRIRKSRAKARIADCCFGIGQRQLPVV